MLLRMEPEVISKLKNRLEQLEDCERAGESYVIDVFGDQPSTAEIMLTMDGVDILAAGELVYSKEYDGWYMGERIEDPTGRIAAWIAEVLKDED